MLDSYYDKIKLNRSLITTLSTFLIKSAVCDESWLEPSNEIKLKFLKF